MRKYLLLYLPLVLSVLAISSCKTVKKSKQDVGFIGKKYHDMTARYNGYFNAKELYNKNIEDIKISHTDNFSTIIPIYEYNAEFDRSILESDMDKVIEKVTKVAALHEPSQWVDDCYALMGKAQYLKGDLETAQETFEYFVADFNPKDPDSRVYISPTIKETSQDKRKKAEKERKIQQSERDQARKAKEKDRAAAKKEREKAAKNRKKNPQQRAKDAKAKLEERLANVQAPDNSNTKNTNQVSFDPDEEYIASFENKPPPPRVTELQSSTGGFLKHTPAYQEGVYWLAKTYIARSLWLEANYFLDKLESEEKLNGNLEELTAIARADYYVGQEDFNNAIPALDNAISMSANGRVKARMAFIKGQISERLGRADEAFAAYEQVKKYNPSFEVRLHAEMNQIKNSWAAHKLAEKDAVNQLNRLANQAKYENFRSSIYSSIAEIKLASGDEVAALEYFNKALESGGSADKTELFYRLATLFYAKEDFVKAKNYFDSTAMVITSKDKRKPEVDGMARNLHRISLNIQTINLKDSLLRLSEMPEKELRSYAEKMARTSLEIKSEAEQQSSMPSGVASTAPLLAGDSKFFAYNPASKDRGFRDFITRWGSDRTRENNWRRRNRPDRTLLDMSSPDGAAPSFSAEDLDIEMNKILREIPTSPDDRATALATREKAMYELGTGFRTLINKYEKSGVTLEKLLHEHPQFDKKPEVYFFQYLNYTDINDKVKANEYFNKLMEEYPHSEFAQYLRNPNSKDGLMTEKRKIELYYDKTYELFTADRHDDAYSRLINSADLFPGDHHMIAKFDLLKAMIIGKLKGQDDYVNALRGVILKYNNTPEQTYARELLRFIRGDDAAFGKDVTTEDLATFALEDDRLHYLIVVVYNANKGQIEEINKKIEAFNEKYYKEKRLRLGDMVLDQEAKTSFILIRRFNNKDDAMVYYNNAIRAGSNYIDTNTFSYELFAINQKNYREVMNQKSVNSYRQFFEFNYLNK